MIWIKERQLVIQHYTNLIFYLFRILRTLWNNLEDEHRAGKPTEKTGEKVRTLRGPRICVKSQRTNHIFLYFTYAIHL